MTKRFNVFDVEGTVFLEDHEKGSYHIGEKEDVDIPCLNDIADRLNTYAEENKQLKRDRLENYKAYKKLLNENEELKEAMKRMMIDMMDGG